MNILQPVGIYTTELTKVVCAARRNWRTNFQGETGEHESLKLERRGDPWDLTLFDY
jgi:hypothetical protein